MLTTMLTRPRVIARLDIKGAVAVKGRCMDGWRPVGNPNELARQYYEQGADELLLVDVVASLYGREPRWDVLEAATDGVFIPVTYCGGVRSVDDVRTAMRHGADKVAINSAALARPELINEAAAVFGSQAIVISIEAKRRADGTYEAYFNSGREPSGNAVGAWANEAQERGAGEIVVTSVDRDGTDLGLDNHLVQQVAHVNIPLLAAGGIASRFPDSVVSA